MPEEEASVLFAENVFICLENFLQLDFDEVVERVNMLFHKTLDFKKCRKKFPFVLLQNLAESSFSIK